MATDDTFYVSIDGGRRHISLRAILDIFNGLMHSRHVFSPLIILLLWSDQNISACIVLFNARDPYPGNSTL